MRCSPILVLHQVPLQPAHNHLEHGEVSSLDKGEVAAGEEVRDVEGCLVDKTSLATVSANVR